MVTTTIGSDAGRDYATIGIWEAATDTSLTTQVVGECYHDGVAKEPTFIFSSLADRIDIAGATNTSSSRYRVLRAATDQQYDPVARTGVWIKRQAADAGGIKGDAIRISEDYFRLERMAVVLDAETPPAAGTSIGIQFRDTNSGYCTRVFIDWGAHYCNGVQGTAFGTAIERFGTPSTGFLRMYNCIVVGGGKRGVRGTEYGIRFQSGSNGIVIGCTVVDVVGHNISAPGSVHGIGPFSTGTVVVYNCISVCELGLVTTAPNHANFAFGALTGSQGWISSDVSGETYSFGGSDFNKAGVVKSQLFVSEINNDYRLLSSAPAQDWFDLRAHYTTYNLNGDFTGSTRSASYADIGALDGSVIGAEASPTRVVSTIGTGGDYADPQAWEAATKINLVEANQVHIGEMLGNFVETGASDSALVMAGAITDPVRYRELRPAKSNHYKPSSDAGCTISTTGTTGYPVVSVEEKYFRLTGPMKITATGLSTSAATGTGGVVFTGFDADGVTLDGIYITVDSTAAAASFYSGVLARDGQQKCTLKNCVIYGHNGADNLSIYAGVRIRDYGQWKIYNNSIFGTKISAAFADQLGIKIDSSITCEIKNNIVIDCNHASGSGSADYAIGSTPTTACGNNISGDATAPGDNSLTGKTAANTWVNTSARDYYLKAGTSEAREAGLELLPDITVDAQRSGRYRPYGIGALEGVKPYPLFPTSARRRRVCHCYEIIRRDGVRLLFTDNNTPLTFFGETWSPASMDATARRQELGMKASDLETSGGITSDKITLLDLRAGRYQGARVVEYLVDWRYPHLKPFAEIRYAIESTTFDAERWKADIKGLPFILQNKVGDVFGRTCRYVLGDGECRAALTGLTQTNKTVLDVIDKRLSWYVAAAALTSTVLNYYGLGKLTWLTGNNQLIETELFRSEVVVVNALADPNLLLSSSANWSVGAITTTTVTNGFDTSINSFSCNLDLGAGDHFIKQVNVGGSATKWSAYAPLDSKVCLSVWVRTKGLANPASGTCQVQLTNIGATDIAWEGVFEHTSGVWSAQRNDVGTTAEVSTTGAPAGGNWYRLSLARYALGDEPDKIGVQLIFNGSVGEDIEIAEAQLELDVLSPTSWTVSTKHKLQLAIRADADIANGDTFNLDPGCDKLLATCKDKFSNIKNFGGFPYIPGVDKMFDTPTQ